MDRIYGIPIMTDRFLTERKLVVHKPDPFIEYDERDHGWLVYFGYAAWQDVPSEKVYHFGNRYVMHPAMLEKVKAAMQVQEKRRVAGMVKPPAACSTSSYHSLQDVPPQFGPSPIAEMYKLWALTIGRR